MLQLSAPALNRLCRMREVFGQVDVAWSERDGSFRAVARSVAITDGHVQRLVGAFGLPTPSDAVHALWDELAVEGARLVIDHWRDGRREFRWAEQHGTWVLVSDGGLPEGWPRPYDRSRPAGLVAQLVVRPDVGADR